jgi:hypothetical protein
MATTTKIQRRHHRRRIKPLTKARLAALARQMLKPYCNIECFYGGGLSGDVDATLAKLAGKVSSSSGMWLATGIRDIAFNYPSVAKASAAAKRIKAAKVKGEDGKRVRVMMHGFWKA